MAAPADLIRKIRRIEIATRRAVLDTLAGGYHSVFKGRGMAFSEVRPYQPGDQVSYYVTGVGARVKVNEAAKLAVSWDEAAPDENTAYYLAKLDDLYDKFRPLIEQDGLRPAGETEAPTEPSQATLEF